jgi:hypothetical protein
MTDVIMKTLRTGETVAEVCTAAKLSDEAGALVATDPAPRDFVGSLIDEALYADAVGFIAHVLPLRESVWWAWSCARDAMGAEPTAAVVTAIESTRHWIVQPTDENRRAAGSAAEALDYGSAPAIAALAAFMCGDTMGPADAAPAPAPPGVVPKTVAGCICMAAAAGKPEEVVDRFKRFIARGMERADKGKVWTPEDDARAEG